MVGKSLLQNLKYVQQPVNIISYLSIQILYLTAIYNFKMRLIIVCLIFSLALSEVIQLSKQVKHKRLYIIVDHGWGWRTGCLDEHGGGEAQAYPCNGGDYQKWWARDAGKGYIFIQSYRSGNYLDSNGDGDAYTLSGNGGQYQQWQLQDWGDYKRVSNRATGRYLYRGKWTDTIKTVQSYSDGDGFQFQDITPDFDCPQMDDYIGNANGQLTFGKGFSGTCWSIEYWKSDKGVTVGAQCWTDNRQDSRWSTMEWQAFGECL